MIRKDLKNMFEDDIQSDEFFEVLIFEEELRLSQLF